VAYNKYRQPLSIDVNISIKPAATGIAAYLNEFESSKLNSNEVNHDGINKVATNISAPTAGNSFNSDATGDSPMTTIGNILESFRPMDAFDTKQGSSSSVSTSALFTSPGQVATAAASNQAKTNNAKAARRKHVRDVLDTVAKYSRKL